MKIKLFGITKELVGKAEIELPETVEIKTVGELKNWLFSQFPDIGGLNSLAVAVDHDYAEDHELLNPNQEVALIPPVSGG